MEYREPDFVILSEPEPAAAGEGESKDLFAIQNAWAV